MKRVSYSPSGLPSKGVFTWAIRLFATGFANFPDALAAGPFAGRNKAFLLLAEPLFKEHDHWVCRRYMNQYGNVNGAYVVGGESAVSRGTANSLADALNMYRLWWDSFLIRHGLRRCECQRRPCHMGAFPYYMECNSSETGVTACPAPCAPSPSVVRAAWNRSGPARPHTCGWGCPRRSRS